MNAFGTRKLLNKDANAGGSSGRGNNEFAKNRDNELKAFYALTSGKPLSAGEQKKYAKEVNPMEISGILKKAETQGAHLDADAKKILETRYASFVNSAPVSC